MLRITVENSQQNEEFILPNGKRAELGRLVTAAEGVLDVWLKDSTCSRNQLRLTEQSDGAVLVENLSANVSIRRPSGADIAPLGSISLACPFTVSAGATTVKVDGEAAPGPTFTGSGWCQYVVAACCEKTDQSDHVLVRRSA